MGRWTLDHHDDVLRDKLKSLVAGAVKRAMLEKGEPTITYEAFVQDLDAGDAFTSSLIDVLVKEMAERRTRPNPVDRRLFISERTAKSLSQQASSRVYQSRPRRRFNFSDYLPASVPELDPSDDEDFGQPQGSSSLEGVRINSDLYDAYSPAHGHDGQGQSDQGTVLARLPDLPALPDGVIDRHQVTSPRPHSPPFSGFRNSFWGSTSPNTSLVRSTSIRRSGRARSEGLSDFLRRGVPARHSASHDAESSRSEQADGSWQFSTTSHTRQDDAETSLPTILPPTRRFFPLSAWATSRRRPPGLDIWGPEPRAPSPLASTSSSAPQEAGPSTSHPWYSWTSDRTTRGSLSPSISRRGSQGDAVAVVERPQVLAPRLRRGGLRAPESFLSRYASPGTTSVSGSLDTALAGNVSDDMAPRFSRPGSASENQSPGTRTTDPSLSFTTQVAHQLLTPRSASPASGDA